MFKIGADPELFLVENGKFISAETKEGVLLPGTKAKPFRTSVGAVQVDGVAAEFNINAATSCDEFYNNIKGTLKDLKSIVNKNNPRAQLAATPVATFDPEYFKNLPKKALELGCEPDYDAYTEKANPRPKTNKPMRTASGHVHIGWTKDANPTSTGHMMDCILVTKELDKYLYFASLDWDKDNVRRKLYGKIGSFRPKSYGVEYRVLSNVWLKNPETVRNVYRITNAVVRSLDSGKHDVNLKLEGQYGDTNTDKVLSALSGYVDW